MPFTSISAGWIFTLMGLLDDGRPLNQGKSQIDYLFRDRQVVRSIIDQQSWKYYPDTGNWVRTNLIPVFK